MSELDDIIIPLEAVLFSEDGYTTLKERRRFYRKELKLQIKSLMLEIVGNDEEDYISGMDDGQYDDTQWDEKARHRNELREELRKRVEKL